MRETIDRDTGQSALMEEIAIELIDNGGWWQCSTGNGREEDRGRGPSGVCLKRERKRRVWERGNGKGGNPI